jgi:hypothetical protein
MFLDAAPQHADRFLSVRRVVIDDVRGRFLESEPSDFRRHRQPVSAVAFAQFEQVDRGLLLPAAATFFVAHTITAVPDPPHAAALS